ncbi:MAG: PAS domain-containing protein [Terracidiphilus sp.]
MAAASEYTLEPIRDRAEFTLYRARQRGNPMPLLAVAPIAEPPPPRSLRRLEHEYSLAAELEHTWAAKPLALTHHEGRTILVLADPGGEPLDCLLERDREQSLDLAQFLHRAINLATALGHVHERGLIHKDVKPENVLVDDASHVWLVGFGIASRLPRERQTPVPRGSIAGTLAYMSPEQTGRMNRSMDSRSDLYSLGVTLYQMLTGELPFAAADPLEWVHCHIARQPIAPADRREVPELLSAIIMKLLAKNAEARYQTAAGLEADLRRCLVERQSQGRIDPFTLGVDDSSDRLFIPEKLYGREREVEALLAAFDRVVAQGAAELVLVSGYSGVGKSSVVNELHKVLVPSHGLFAAGKFDQYKRDIPYATLAQAFQTLVRQILVKSEVELDPWRHALLEALGPNGQLIVNLIHELEFIIGKQPPVAELPPQEARGRFQLVFQRFLGAFATAEHPLALFLDDLQWLDTATLELLERLIADPDVQYLLLIGAYRDNEVSSSHPLKRTLSAIREAGAKTQEIVLASLGLEDVGRLVSDSLRCEREAAGLLAQLVHEKTGGNPFFAIQLLTALAEERLLRFDRNSAAWIWDLSRIRAKGYSDNVVDLMVGKLRRLADTTQAALQQLACLGNVAEIATLSVVFGQSEEEIQTSLLEAVSTGLVLRLEGLYAFLHDRIQEAAYALIPENARAKIHLRIGRILVAHTTSCKLDKAIFEIVNQLNRASTLVTAPEERVQLAEFNLLAGKRAQASSAYVSALNYLTTGAALLTRDSWQQHRKLTFDLELDRAHCEFASGAIAGAEERLRNLSIRAVTTGERVAVACLQVDLYQGVDRSDAAVAVGLSALRHLGVDFPERPTEADARRAYDGIWTQLGARAIEDLINLPLMSDHDSLAALDLLIRVAVPGFFYSYHLGVVAVCTAVSLGLERGHSDASCIAYAQLGMLAGPHFGQFDAGYRFGRLGCELAERPELHRFQARTFETFGFVLPWTQHVRKGRAFLFRGFDLASRIGEISYAGYACGQLNTNYLLAGDPLIDAQEQAERGLAFARKVGFGTIEGWILGQLGLIRTLRGLTSRFGSFDDAAFLESDLERSLAGNPALALPECWYYIRKLQARFLAGEYANALQAASRAQPMVWGTTLTLLEVAEFYFYDALCHAAVHESASPDDRKYHLARLTGDLEKLDTWGSYCPENFANRAALVGAEVARIEGRALDAERLYERAINSARAADLVHNQALANELAGQFYMGLGLETAGYAHLRNARNCYDRWGAHGKVRQLDERYPRLREGRTLVAPATVGPPIGQLDVETVVKASQAISSEMLLAKLIEKLLRIVVENAGAERGLLILFRGGEPWIEAEATACQGAVEVAVKQAVVMPSDLPQSALHYMIRTQESVLLDDASADDLYSKDEYVRLKRSRSILCLPIVKQAKLVGALYLENNLAPFVFTPERVAVLHLLASQAAISLENAVLFTDLQRSETFLAQGQRISRTGSFGRNILSEKLYWSEETYRIYELDRSDEPTLGWLIQRIHHEDRARVQQTIENATRQRTGFDIEYRLLTRDNSVKYLHVVVQALENASGELEFMGAVTDITELKKAERNLGLIIDTIPTLSWCNRTDGSNEFLSKSWHEYTGLPPEEAHGWGWQVAFHPEDLPPLMKKWGEMLASGEPGEIEARLRRSDGIYRWFLIRAEPFRDESGTIVRWYGTSTDIEDRRRSEEALRESEQSFRLILDGIAGLVAIMSATGEIEVVNRQVLEYFGRTTEQLKGWSTGNEVHPDDLPGVYAAWVRSLETMCVYDVDHRLRRADGEYRWFHARGLPLFDPEGRVLRWYVLLTDIHDRKRAEENVRHSEALLAESQRLSLTGSFVWRVATDAIALSMQLYRIFEFDQAAPVTFELIGTRIHPEDLPMFRELVERSRRDGSDMELELRLQMPDRSVKYLHIVAHNRADGDQPEYIGAVQDVTQRRLSEEALTRARAELAHVVGMTSMGVMTASIAHEVNQPLSGIITNASTCLRMLNTDPPNLDGARETAKRTLRDGNRASDVVTRLRTLYGKKEPSLEPMDLNEAAREVIALQLSELQRNGAILQLEFAVDLPIVEGDRIQLQQVILNLVRNASDAMRDIEDRPRRLQIRTEQVDENVCVAVQDSGIGFAPASADRLFESFYTTKPEGMGIGLSVSRSIIEAHGGRLWATANDGPGATFVFSIPCKHPTEFGREPASAQTP